VRHLAEIGHTVAADQILSQRQRQLGSGIYELRGFNLLAQGDGLPVDVRNFDADRRFSRDALNEDRFGL
jgi:hypothetical protein